MTPRRTWRSCRFSNCSSGRTCLSELALIRGVRRAWQRSKAFPPLAPGFEPPSRPRGSPT
jgi:hypothetical protein